MLEEVYQRFGTFLSEQQEHHLVHRHDEALWASEFLPRSLAAIRPERAAH